MQFRLTDILFLILLLKLSEASGKKYEKVILDYSDKKNHIEDFRKVLIPLLENVELELEPGDSTELSFEIKPPEKSDTSINSEFIAVIGETQLKYAPSLSLNISSGQTSQLSNDGHVVTMLEYILKLKKGEKREFENVIKVESLDLENDKRIIRFIEKILDDFERSPVGISRKLRLKLPPKASDEFCSELKKKFIRLLLIMQNETKRNNIVIPVTKNRYDAENHIRNIDITVKSRKIGPYGKIIEKGRKIQEGKSSVVETEGTKNILKGVDLEEIQKRWKSRDGHLPIDTAEGESESSITKIISTDNQNSDEIIKTGGSSRKKTTIHKMIIPGTSEITTNRKTGGTSRKIVLTEQKPTDGADSTMYEYNVDEENENPITKTKSADDENSDETTGGSSKNKVTIHKIIIPSETSEVTTKRKPSVISRKINLSNQIPKSDTNSDMYEYTVDEENENPITKITSADNQNSDETTQTGESSKNKLTIRKMIIPETSEVTTKRKPSGTSKKIDLSEQIPKGATNSAMYDEGNENTLTKITSADNQNSDETTDGSSKNKVTIQKTIIPSGQDSNDTNSAIYEYNVDEGNENTITKIISTDNQNSDETTGGSSKTKVTIHKTIIPSETSEVTTKRKPSGTSRKIVISEQKSKDDVNSAMYEDSIEEEKENPNTKNQYTIEKTRSSGSPKKQVSLQEIIIPNFDSKSVNKYPTEEENTTTSRVKSPQYSVETSKITTKPEMILRKIITSNQDSKEDSSLSTIENSDEEEKENPKERIPSANYQYSVANSEEAGASSESIKSPAKPGEIQRSSKTVVTNLNLRPIGVDFNENKLGMGDRNLEEIQTETAKPEKGYVVMKPIPVYDPNRSVQKIIISTLKNGISKGRIGGQDTSSVLLTFKLKKRRMTGQEMNQMVDDIHSDLKTILPNVKIQESHFSAIDKLFLLLEVLVDLPEDTNNRLDTIFKSFPHLRGNCFVLPSNLNDLNSIIEENLQYQLLTSRKLERLKKMSTNLCFRVSKRLKNISSLTRKIRQGLNSFQGVNVEKFYWRNLNDNWRTLRADISMKDSNEQDVGDFPDQEHKVCRTPNWSIF